MRASILLLFVLLIQPGFAQPYYRDIIKDRVTINLDGHNVTAYVLPLKQRKQARKDRSYYWYSANSIEVTQGGYAGKLLNGLFTDFYGNKNLCEQGVFRKGLKSREWKSWYENGRLREVTRWKSGLLSGPFRRYDEQGRLEEKGTYKRGELSGKVICYVHPDSAGRPRYFKKGKETPPPKKRSVIYPFLKKLMNKQKNRDKIEENQTGKSK